MNQTCAHCTKSFVITATDERFYATIKAPLPRLCPPCRLQRRLAFRNERSLFMSVCGLCQKNILSLYNPADQFTVYCNDCWWSDRWDSLSYGQEIDWNRSLLEQYNEVRKRVPRLALVSLNSENSDYTNMSADLKDCYLLFASEKSENCSYGKLVQNCRDCFDCSFIYDSELCYYCINVRNCYRSIYLQDCQDSKECGFSIGLKGCSNVFLSANLHNKQYYIRNQPVAPDDYHRQVQQMMGDPILFKQCIEDWRKLNEGRVVKFAQLIKSEDSTGDNLSDCKRVRESFDVTSGHDCHYVTDALTPKDCYDASYIYYQPELVYDGLSMLQPYNVQYSTFVFYSSDIQYCDQVHNAKRLLLSSCVRGKENTILNKAYSPEEFDALREKIIAKMTVEGEYGHLPTMTYSLFAYNDTVAQEYFPLTKEQALQQGLRWNDEAEARVHKPFKLTQSEKAFYQIMQLPEPTLHPELRHRQRMNWRNRRQLYHRTCQCQASDHGHGVNCSQQFQTTYQSTQPEVVYCEICYQKLFY